MKDILEEMGKYESYIKGSEERLASLVLTDVIGYKVKVVENEDGTKALDYSEFEKLVNSVKTFLNVVDPSMIKQNDLLTSIKEDCKNEKNVIDECSISLRTLTWVKEILEKDGSNNA